MIQPGSSVAIRPAAGIVEFRFSPRPVCCHGGQQIGIIITVANRLNGSPVFCNFATANVKFIAGNQPRPGLHPDRIITMGTILSHNETAVGIRLFNGSSGNIRFYGSRIAPRIRIRIYDSGACVRPGERSCQP